MIRKIALLVTLVFASIVSFGQDNWKASWITAFENQNETNTWIVFKKEINISQKPSSLPAMIAADSKYWLWINGKMVIFEGALKRGPNAHDTYYDEVDIAKYLNTGKNTIAVLLWYFGKEGFAHKSSGKAGLIFQASANGVEILSDTSWQSAIHPAYEMANGERPNFRLAESNIRFNAMHDIGAWYESNAKTTGANFGKSVDLGKAPTAPWNKLVKRPIPMWKDFGMKDYVSKRTISGTEFDTLECKLPYNLQFTPYFKIEAEAGKTIHLRTDNSFAGGTPNIRAEYVTRNGAQEYENMGWMNGHYMFYIIPKGVKVIDVKFRETGYDTEFAGSFTSSDPFFNKLWDKAARTLYITMRDTYMDCPDRERAQWIGDEVNEAGEAFYALDTKSHLLQRKGMYELIGWQRADSSLFAPVPSGNWNIELPSQCLTMVGQNGFWNYYLNTGDKQTIADLYEGVKKYLAIWKLNDTGTVVFRAGDWTWGDWGENVDVALMYNPLYYLGLKGAQNMANLLGKKDDAAYYQKQMDILKPAFNKAYWNGKEYRSTGYQLLTDDRCQALAVVSGLADKDKYPAILEVLKKQEHASPYMEKYVTEALFMMGEETYGLERHKKRFAPMVNNDKYTTLFEGWGIGEEGFGGGTINHAWSGGGLTILSQYVCGIAPVEAAYKVFHILPQPGNIEKASATVQSVAGIIKSSFANSASQFILDATVPSSTTAIIGVPAKGVKRIVVNKKTIWSNGKFLSAGKITPENDQDGAFIKFRVAAGNYNITATR